MNIKIQMSNLENKTHIDNGYEKGDKEVINQMKNI